MSIVSSRTRSFIALPLTLAMSTLLISACSNTSTVKNTGVANSPIVTKRPTNQPVVTPPNTSSTDYSTAYLDAESLDELADLLEATDMTMVEGNKLAIQQYGDLWNRLRAGYRMNGGQPQYNQRIEAQKSWFTSRQDYLNRLAARSSRYLYHTVREAERRNIPTELALLPVIESSYDPSATSSAAAAGLWQFIPSTGRIYGLNQSSTYDGRRDVIESTRAAYDFLTALYNQFGSWELALASYNAGPGRIQKAIDANAAQGLPTDFWSLRLPTETMNYVPRFLAVADIVSKPEQYGVYLPAIANRQHFRSVPVNYGVSLAEVAQATSVSYEELERLNTALISGRIDASGPQRVVIPNEVAQNVDSTLSTLKGYGTSNVLASSSQSAPITAPSYNSQPYSGSALPSTGSGLADFAASASVPQQTTQYIPPTTVANNNSVYNSNTSFNTEPPITRSETTRINTELKDSNSLPTTSAQITQNNTITQEPPLSREERDFIASQIQRQTAEVREVISPVDGNIKLSAIQTGQSVLEATGKEKKLSFASNNNTSKPKPQGQRSTYTVKSGDTLANIGSRAGVNWRDIAEWNQIDANAKLYSGSVLYLYGAQPITTGNNSTTTSPKPSTPSQPDSYIVQGGDTLTGTANRFGLSVTQLASYNNLSSRAELLRGQKLWLVAGKVTAPVNTPAQPSSQPSKNTTTGATKNYTIKSGDNLSALARQFNISIDTLTSLNNMSIADSIYVGQTLTVPANVNVSNTASSNSNASSTNNSASNSSSVATTNYKVKAGDTLIGIANSIGMSAEQVAAVNSNFDAKARLQQGQTIKVPVSKEQVALKLNDESVSYKVSSGDTLTGVAKRYNITISDLAAANGLNSNSQLILGRNITIPAKGSVPVSSKNAPATNTAPTSQPSGGKSFSNTEDYKVQAGDGMISIARRFGVAVADLAATNNIAANASLQRGQNLKVPKLTVSYKVASGDTLIGLARKYGMSTKELADMNNMAVDAMLQRGQNLTVPNR